LSRANLTRATRRPRWDLPTRWPTCRTTRRGEGCSMSSRSLKNSGQGGRYKRRIQLRRSAMYSQATLRSYGAGESLLLTGYKHCAPTELRIGLSCLMFLVIVMAFSSCARRSEAGPARKLRVCADPNNLPFSNQRLEGFENKIAGLLARDLNAEVEYTWWAQRRGFIRNTLKARACDVVMGVPSGFEMAQTTAPYYRSTYVFVYRQDSGLKVGSFDDPVLHKVKIGVQVIGDDGANAPPAHALSNRGIVGNVRGYTVYG